MSEENSELERIKKLIEIFRPMAVLSDGAFMELWRNGQVPEMDETKVRYATAEYSERRWAEADAEILRLRDELRVSKEERDNVLRRYRELAGRIDQLAGKESQSHDERKAYLEALEVEDVKFLNMLNTILLPGMEWVDLLREYRAAGEHGVEWLGTNGQYLDLYQARLIEALREAASKLVKKP